MFPDFPASVHPQLTLALNPLGFRFTSTRLTTEPKPKGPKAMTKTQALDSIHNNHQLDNAFKFIRRACADMHTSTADHFSVARSSHVDYDLDQLVTVAEAYKASRRLLRDLDVFESKFSRVEAAKVRSEIEETE